MSREADKSRRETGTGKPAFHLAPRSSAAQDQQAVLRLLDEALLLVREVYGYAVHQPNTRRVDEAIGRIRAKAVRYGGTRPLG